MKDLINGLEYKGLVLNKIGVDPQLIKLRICSELAPFQVLVKVICTGICGKQLEEIAGAGVGGQDPYLPHLLGHEGSGIVEAIGDSVTHVSPGDLVVLHWITEFKTPTFQLPRIIDVESGNHINGGPITTFSEFTVVSANRVTAVPHGTDPRVAALLGCGLTTGLGAVFNEAKICNTDQILVIGCGGVGLSVIQGCKIIDPVHIAALDLSEAALVQASLCGAQSLMKINQNDDLDSFDLTRFTHVFYCIGSTELLQKLHARLSFPSSIYMLGVPDPRDSITLNARHIHQRKSLHGSYGGLTRPSADFPLYLDMIKHGLINPSVLIGETFGLFQSSIAFAKARAGSGKRVQFKL